MGFVVGKVNDLVQDLGQVFLWFGIFSVGLRQTEACRGAGMLIDGAAGPAESCLVTTFSKWRVGPCLCGTSF